MSTSTKMPRPTHLTINPKSATEAPPNSNAPNSSPVHFEGVDLSSLGGEFPAPSTTLTSLPPLPSSPPTSPRHHRDPSKGILRSLRNRSQPDHEARGRGRQIKQVKGEGENALQGSSSVAQMYKLQHRNGSTPELSLIGSADNVNGKVPADGTNAQSSETRPPPASHHGEDGSTKRKDKGPFRNPLGRSKSIRRDSQSKTQAEKPVLEAPPKTAPLPPDRKEEMQRLKSAKDKRGRSAERPVHRESDEGAQLRQAKDKDKKEHGFVTAGKNVASRTSKAGGNFLTRLGKIGRSSSNHERDVPDSEYVLKVINQPLVEQTRITRISKDLSNCRDKTEYWMPSLPWRCIDYLNLNCESEGLYRVPGSGPQVKHWQRRFDTELDLDLLSEPDLFDPNNIGSMLKAWLRDLPTEIMPSALQNSLAAELEKENADYAKMGQPAPQRLRDALSELSPFKYYLLFAITCHLSLLLSHKDKNRMDLNNLCICIGPCLKLERWLFNYLVGDWRHCWQGCFTEKEYLEAERAHEQGLQYNLPASKSSVNLSQQMSGEGGEERAVYSSASSEPGRADDARPSTQSDDHAHAQQQKRRGEDSAPETYRPTASREQSSGKSPATRGVATAQTASGEARRPSTAEGGGEGTPANQKTPRPKGQQHSRSKSDVATTPTRGGEEEVGFPPVPTGRRE